MAAIVVATVVGWWTLLPEIAPKRIVIAVLPFDERDAGAGERWLGDGLAEDVRLALALTPHFTVLARAAAFAYRDRPERLRALAEELGATHAVVGQTASGGGGLAVSARLVHLADGTALWEDEWSGGEADLFAIRDNVARAVAQKLLLLGESRISAGPPVAPDAYQAFLRGRELAHGGDRDEARNWALRSLALADNPYARVWLGRGHLLRGEVAVARSHVNAALQAAPGFPPALALAQWWRCRDEDDANPCFQALHAMAEERRDGHAMRWLAQLYQAGGFAEDAALLRDVLRRQDPAGADTEPHLPALAIAPEALNAIDWKPASALLAH